MSDATGIELCAATELVEDEWKTSAGLVIRYKVRPCLTTGLIAAAQKVGVATASLNDVLSVSETGPSIAGMSVFAEVARTHLAEVVSAVAPDGGPVRIGGVVVAERSTWPELFRLLPYLAYAVGQSAWIAGLTVEKQRGNSSPAPA